MGISDWVRRKLAIIAIATANVEKNALNNEGKSMSDNLGSELKLSQERLSESLINGEITQEVKDLRWRMYKVLNNLSGAVSKRTGRFDADGEEIIETTFNNHLKLDKIKVDDTDEYPLEKCIYNNMIKLSISDVVNNLDINIFEENVSFDNLGSGVAPRPTIVINREFPTKINIENYVKKVNIRTINESEKLVEFCVSKYPDEFDRKTNFFISEIKKCIVNPRSSNIIDINGLAFITDINSLGANENLLYEYDLTSFYKIVEFNEFYVIKYKAHVIVDGENQYLKYEEAELEEKYKNKVKKDVL